MINISRLTVVACKWLCVPDKKNCNDVILLDICIIFYDNRRMSTIGNIISHFLIRGIFQWKALKNFESHKIEFKKCKIKNASSFVSKRLVLSIQFPFKQSVSCFTVSLGKWVIAHMHSIKCVCL